MDTGSGTTVLAAKAEVRAHNSVLRKELGILDLVLAQILLVVVPDFFGAAVKAGPSHVVLWLVAILLFFIPQAVVVSNLNRLMPLEGGLFEWARLAFNDKIGFLVAWNLWLYVLSYSATIGLVTITFAAYALGPQSLWMVANRWLLFATSALLILGLILVARLGLGVGKWVSNTGSLLTVITLLVLVAMPFVNVTNGTLAGYHPLRLVLPPLTLFSLSVFSKMAFGALCGFEYVAIFAGESRNPGRNVALATLITAPIIALLYILGTSSILAFVSPNAVDVIGPIPQALRQSFQSFELVRIIVPLSIMLLLGNYLSVFSLNFSANARLPMVAGWEHLLPEWFTRLHAKHRTPVNSIWFLGGVTLAASLAALIGVGRQEAFELLQIWGFTFYGLAYLALFAIPLFAKKESGIGAGLGMRLASASGLFITLLFVLLSIFPIIEVESSLRYAAKIAGVVLGANLLGWMVYRVGQRNNRGAIA